MIKQMKANLMLGGPSTGEKRRNVERVAGVTV